MNNAQPIDLAQNLALFLRDHGHFQTALRVCTILRQYISLIEMDEETILPSDTMEHEILESLIKKARLRIVRLFFSLNVVHDRS